MEGTDRDYRGEPDAMAKAAFEFAGSPIEEHLKNKRNHITIDDVADLLDKMGIDTDNIDNDDFFEAVLDTIVNNGGRIVDDSGFDLDLYRGFYPNASDELLTKLAKMEYDDADENEIRIAYMDGKNKSTPIDDNGHVDASTVEEDDDDDDFDWEDVEVYGPDDRDDEDFDYDKIAAYAKDKPVANEPASDERVKSNKKPCADKPGKEVASDEECKDKKGACSVEKDNKEDMMKFSDESLKNIVGVLADRIL